MKNPHRTQAMPTPDDAPWPRWRPMIARVAAAGHSWTGRFRFCILQTGKKSRETVGLTVARTCTQQGLNRYMFHNCGAAAYGPINLKENLNKDFIYE